MFHKNHAVFFLKTGAKIHHFFHITGFHHAAVCPVMPPKRPPTRIGMPPNPWCCVRGCAREACRTTGFPVCGQNNLFPPPTANICARHCETEWYYIIPFCCNVIWKHLNYTITTIYRDIREKSPCATPKTCGKRDFFYLLRGDFWGFCGCCEKKLRTQRAGCPPGGVAG